MAINITPPEHYIEFKRSNFADRRLDLERNGGVYVIYDYSGIVMYVGQSKNLYGRLRDHIRGAGSMWDRRKQIARVRAYIVNDAYEREIYETYLIHTLRPYANIAKVHFNVADEALIDELYEIDERVAELERSREDIADQLAITDEYDDEWDDPESWELGTSLWEGERQREIDEEIRKLHKRRREIRRLLT